MTPRTYLLTALAMLAFAGNSLLCRLALRDTALDPASFTLLRLSSGAVVLLLLLRQRNGSCQATGSWAGAIALFVYAAGFSFAYTRLDAASGALLLFGAVQLGMLGWGLLRGERLAPGQWLGMLVALAGVLTLLLPGASAPPLLAAGLMLAAGAAWAAYSLIGRSAGEPLAATTGSFLRAAPLGLAMAVVCAGQLHWDALGALWALLSGGLTSALGYALWYQVLPRLGALRAASTQLSVPPLTALGGALVLGEAPSVRLLLASLAILGGVALVLKERRQRVSGD